MATKNVTIFDAQKIYFSERDVLTGALSAPEDVGLSTAFTFTLTNDKKELRSPRGALIQSIALLPTASVSIDLRDITAENLARGLKAVLQEIAAGAVTVNKTNAAAGEVVFLDGLNLTGISVTKDATPLVAGTDYVADAKFGRVEFLTAQTGALVISGTSEAQKAFGLLTDSTKEYSVRIEAIDLANGRPCVFELYRVKFSPLSDFGLVGEDFATIPLTGDVLEDATKPVDAQFGKFGRYRSLI